MFSINYGSYVIFQGEEGVREVLQILNDEFRLSMALSGETCDAKPLKLLIYLCQNKYSNIIYIALIQAAGTWQKSTGTSFSSLNSNRPAEGSTEDNNSTHWTGSTTEPNQQCWTRDWDSTVIKKLQDVHLRTRDFIMWGKMKHASSFHNLEMTCVWHPICIHAGVYESDSVPGKLRV